MFKPKIITIPLSSEAMYRLDYDQSAEGDLFELLLSKDKYEFFLDIGLFKAINEKLGINIDDYEDATIYNSQFEELKILLSRFKKSYPNNEFLNDFYEASNVAFKCNTGIFFYF